MGQAAPGARHGRNGRLVTQRGRPDKVESGYSATRGRLAPSHADSLVWTLVLCVCYAPDLVGSLTGIRVNSVSRWHHWFPRRYSQEGCARVDPGFVNADAILPVWTEVGR